MKIFFDTEFTGLHKNTTLISIGLVAENSNDHFYAEFTDYDKEQIKNNKWIQDNVIKNLIYGNESIEENSMKMVVGDKEFIRKHLTRWLSKFDNVELVSDVSYFDMVLFVDIFGTSFDLPVNVCPVCHDINQDIARFFGIDEAEAFDKSREEILDDYDISLPNNLRKHNSLYDAYVIKSLYQLMD